MSRLISSMARSWSGVSSYGKASSNCAARRCRGKRRSPAWSPARAYSAQQALGHLLDRLLDPLLDPGPLAAPQLVQAGRLPLHADVPLQQVHLVGGHVQLVVARVLHHQVVLVHAADLQRLDAQVAADAVVDVDHVVAGLEVGKVADAGAAEASRRRAGRRLFARPNTSLSVSTTSLLSGSSTPRLQRTGGHHDVARFELAVEVLRVHGVQAFVPERLHHPLASLRGGEDEADAKPLLAPAPGGTGQTVHLAVEGLRHPGVDVHAPGRGACPGPVCPGWKGAPFPAAPPPISAHSA